MKPDYTSDDLIELIAHVSAINLVKIIFLLFIYPHFSGNVQGRRWYYGTHLHFAFNVLLISSLDECI